MLMRADWAWDTSWQYRAESRTFSPGIRNPCWIDGCGRAIEGGF